MVSEILAFVGGTLFGSVGIKALQTDKAKEQYVKATAATLRAKDSTVSCLTKFKEEADDVLAQAKALNEEKAAQKEAEKASKPSNLIADANA